MIFAIVGGIILMLWRCSSEMGDQNLLDTIIGKNIYLTGQIADDPDTGEGKTSFRLKKLCINCRLVDENLRNEDSKNLELAGAFYISMSTNHRLQRSDLIELEGKLSEGFGVFSGNMRRPRVKKIIRPVPGDVFLNVRNFFGRRIKDFIPEPGSALGLGYLLGVKSSLPDGLAEMLKVVGLTHIIVASGANLSILIEFSRKFFGKVSRLCGFFASLFLVVFYVGMVGMTPSMTRAGIVSGLNLITWYVGRKFQPVRLLILVAAATLIYDPMFIVDLGWMLSFAAFAGIMIINPRLHEFLYGDKKPNLIASTLLETISASLVCLPILLFFFGKTSTIFLLANLLILPTISISMTLVFCTGLLGLISTLLPFLNFLPILFGVVSTIILNYHLWVINFFGVQENFMVEIPSGQPIIFLTYPILIIALNWYRIKECGRKLRTLVNTKRQKSSLARMTKK